VVTQSLFQVFSLAAVVAAGGLALKDVDVKGHDVVPESVNHFVDGSTPGGMQKESPSQDGLDFWLPVTDCCGHYHSKILIGIVEKVKQESTYRNQ
jgi:hypothetical protein